MKVSQELTENLQVQNMLVIRFLGTSAFKDMIWLTSNSNQEQNQEQDRQSVLQSD